MITKKSEVVVNFEIVKDLVVCLVSVLVLRAGSVVSESRMKHRGLWCEICTLVCIQTTHNRTVGVCEMGDHEDSGSGKYELKQWVTRR